MNNGWHKCFLCDCEFLDPEIPGYWAYCPSCKDAMEKPRKPEVIERGFVPSVPSVPSVPFHPPNKGET